MNGNYSEQLKKTFWESNNTNVEELFDNGVLKSEHVILERKAFMSILLTGKIFEKIISQELSNYDLTLQEYLILIGAFFVNVDVNQNTLSKNLFSSKANISKNINNLEKKNLVEKKTNKKNKKENHILITEQGKNLINEILNNYKQKYDGLFEKNDANEIIELNKKLRNNLKNLT